jgi:succinate dehydrogenase / fumarate reductase membrane anchor subunit
MSLRSDLGRVRGLGSAKEGAAHWWAQRVTAVALVPLLLWFVASVVALTGAGQTVVAAWIGQPVHAILLVLLVGAGLYHAQLGLQVVIEDYVHTKWLKLISIIAIKFAAVVIVAATVFAVLKIAFAA